jgi:3-hydroxyisobutyrate dehydrogenase
MGAPMARRLREAGLNVQVWNRTREKAEPLEDTGATVAKTPAEAASGAGIVLTMLADDHATLAVMEGEKGALGEMAPGSVWLQMGTIGLEATRQASELAADAGVELVDAPVLGTRQPAEEGELLVLASGPDGALDRCETVFSAVGSQTLRLGEAGAGSRMKLVINGWLVGILGTLADSLALAESLGVGGAAFLQAIDGGALGMPYAGTMGAKMLAGDYPLSFPLTLAVKDARLIEAAAREAGLEPSVVPAVGAALRRALDLGFGDEDMSAIYEAARAR